MKKMHKIGAGILTVSLMVTAMALPAMAENGQSADSEATVGAMVTARGGRQGGQMPGNGNNRQGQMPGFGNNQQDQMPGNGDNNQGMVPGTPPVMNGQQQQAPQKPETAQKDTQTGKEKTPETQTTEEGATQGNQETQQKIPQTPDGKGPRGGFQKHGRMGPMNGRGTGHVDFRELVEKGIIDEETLTKIEEYLKENAPAKPQMPADGRLRTSRKGTSLIRIPRLRPLRKSRKEIRRPLRENCRKRVIWSRSWWKPEF